MLRPDDEARLLHMLENAGEAVSLIQNRSRADLDADRVLSLALVRLLEVVGEAGSRVTPGIRRNHPEIPWSEIISLRNRLIHGYDAVDLDILWQILRYDLPPLIERLRKMLPPP